MTHRTRRPSGTSGRARTENSENHLNLPEYTIAALPAAAPTLRGREFLLTNPANGKGSVALCTGNGYIYSDGTAV